jgi:hypothetical protein
MNWERSCQNKEYIQGKNERVEEAATARVLKQQKVMLGL